MSNIKSIGQGVKGLRLPKIGGFPLTLNVALTTVLRTNVLHCEQLDTRVHCYIVMSVEFLEVLVIHAARNKLTCLLLPISLLINTVPVALCTKVIPLKISAQKSTFTTVFLTFFGFRRRDRRTDFR